LTAVEGEIMAFFNYSRMQLAAKIVYYGPGLCGKTTNLQYVYQHTTDNSRGEMVSLETATDRTLFFDLLPLEVGSIAGFKTRIQLYTVPGQVFYNTTRKLVLKGVDGVVFVADSQRPMHQANIDSLNNLTENLAGMGLEIDSIPLVLQFNKRDLSEVIAVDDLNQALNRHSWQHYEASAIRGDGVFETLKAISKLTLMELAKRLDRETASTTTRPKSPRPEAAKPAMPPAPPAATTAPSRVASDNGHGRLSREIQLALSVDDLEKVRRLSLDLTLEDSDEQVVHAASQKIDIENAEALEKLLLQLNIQKQS
jgi:signal recognition particle receptor subunit beta